MGCQTNKVVKIIWYWGLGEFPNPFPPASIATSLLVFTATIVAVNIYYTIVATTILAFNNTLKLEREVLG